MMDLEFLSKRDAIEAVYKSNKIIKGVRLQIRISNYTNEVFSKCKQVKEILIMLPFVENLIRTYLKNNMQRKIFKMKSPLVKRKEWC